MEKMECREAIPLILDISLRRKQQEENFRRTAIVLCVVSVILNLILGILSVVFATLRHSPAAFAFAVDCVLDLFSSLIVIWRYFGSPHSTCSLQRENRACMSLGILFIAAGVGVIIEGTYFLLLKEGPEWFTILLTLSAAGFGVCVLMGLAKYILCKKMRSETLFLDALNSFLNALFASVFIISNVAYSADKHIWFLDPVLSIIFSIGLLALGARTISIHRQEGYQASEM